LSLNVYKNRLAKTPFLWEAENNLTYYWRRSGNKGIKFNSFPSITLPWNGKYATSILEAGWEETVYYNEAFQQDSSEEKEIIDRGTASLYGSLSTNLFNTFEMDPNIDLSPESENDGNSAWTRIRHSIRPQLEYSYQSSERRDVPEYALQDTRIPANRITYSLTNSFSRKKDKVVPKKESRQNSEFKVKQDYRNFLLLDLEQSFHISESHRDHKLIQYPRRRFSDVRARLIYNPGPFLKLETNTWFSPTIGELTEHENMVNLHYRDRLSGYLGFDYQKELDHYIHRKDQSSLKILRLGGKWDVNEQWRFTVDYSRDLEESKLLKRSLGISYTHQCWSFNLDITQDSHESSVSLDINLSEIGEHL
ncbi:MAG: LPS assembly protein LptD, partial [Thermodesulfobacteriota bacterium]